MNGDSLWPSVDFDDLKMDCSVYQKVSNQRTKNATVHLFFTFLYVTSAFVIISLFLIVCLLAQ